MQMINSSQEIESGYSAYLHDESKIIQGKAEALFFPENKDLQRIRFRYLCNGSS